MCHRSLSFFSQRCPKLFLHVSLCGKAALLSNALVWHSLFSSTPALTFVIIHRTIHFCFVDCRLNHNTLLRRLDRILEQDVGFSRISLLCILDQLFPIFLPYTFRHVHIFVLFYAQTSQLLHILPIGLLFSLKGTQSLNQCLSFVQVSRQSCRRHLFWRSILTIYYGQSRGWLLIIVMLLHTTRAMNKMLITRRVIERGLKIVGIICHEPKIFALIYGAHNWLSLLILRRIFIQILGYFCLINAARLISHSVVFIGGLHHLNSLDLVICCLSRGFLSKSLTRNPLRLLIQGWGIICAILDKIWSGSVRGTLHFLLCCRLICISANIFGLILNIMRIARLRWLSQKVVLAKSTQVFSWKALAV